MRLDPGASAERDVAGASCFGVMIGADLELDAMMSLAELPDPDPVALR
jgi:hypothetical protein